MKFDYQRSSNISSATLLKTMKTCLSYRNRLSKIVSTKNWNEPESSILLPMGTITISSVKKLAAKFKTSLLKKIVVIGIGGSNLGTQAIYEALQHHKKSTLTPKILFLDTTSSTNMTLVIRELQTCSKKEQFVLIAISKSGSTTETIVNLEVLIDQLKKTFGNILNRLVVISDDGSKFWNKAKEKKIETLAIPDSVGGRYSVFSVVSLFPLLVAGFNASDLIIGAKQSIEQELSKNSSHQYALISACLTFLHMKKNRSIHNSFFFAPELESLGKWYRQLMGESIGKEKNIFGKKVNAGITPIVSIGSTDLHSMAQLYFGGPDDKFTNIISVKSSSDIQTPKTLMFGGLVENIENKGIHEVMSSIVKGVVETFLKLKRPFVTIEFDRIDGKELGMFMQTRMLEMMYLAHLLNVNAFDQPNVEGYKMEVKKQLN